MGHCTPLRGARGCDACVDSINVCSMPKRHLYHTEQPEIMTKQASTDGWKQGSAVCTQNMCFLAY